MNNQTDSASNIAENENKESVAQNTPAKKEEAFSASSIYEAVSVVISSVFIIAMVFTFGFRLVGVSGRSMDTTLSDGDWLIVTPYYDEPTYGDIVISTHCLDLHGPIVKRVIATEGDVVNILPDGTVYVNDEKLDESSYAPLLGGPGRLQYPVTVPEDHVMVLGDNRPISDDSRNPDIGFAPVDSLLGKARLRLSKNYDIYYNFNK